MFHLPDFENVRLRMFNVFKLFLNTYIYIYREREREGERDRLKTDTIATDSSVHMHI